MKYLFSLITFLLILACQENTGPVGSLTNEEVNHPIINEFIAKNKAIGTQTPNLLDEGGGYSDWVELYNPGPKAINLSNYYLSDDRDSLYHFELRDTIIEAGEYYVLFANQELYSIDDITGDTISQYQNHAPFKLSYSCGDELFLILKSDSSIVDSVIFDSGSPIYSELFVNESYGRILDGSDTWGPQNLASPGSANNGRSADPVQDINRDANRVCIDPVI